MEKTRSNPGGDRAGREFWDNMWQRRSFPASISPDSRLHGYTYQKYREFYKNTLRGMDTRNRKLIEIGCARSVWLPYFASEYSFDVFGIDYSEKGCRESRRILREGGIEGTVECADLFRPPAYMKGMFDVVLSLGVIEHFTDTCAAVCAHAEFLKPGGVLIAKIPNLNSVFGCIMPLVDIDFYNTHVPLGTEELEEACRRSGLEVEECGYMGLLEYNIEAIFVGNFPHVLSLLKKEAEKGIKNIAPFMKESAFTSPFINCVAKKE